LTLPRQNRMFDQVKEINKLRKQASQLKREMERITVEVVKGDVRVVMRGDQQVEEVEIAGEKRPDLKEAFNNAVKESQKKVAKKLSGLVSGMKIPNL
jgi:DNA-binding protein YbaB